MNPTSSKVHLTVAATAFAVAVCTSRNRSRTNHDLSTTPSLIVAILAAARVIAGEPAITDARGRGEQPTLSPFRHTLRIFTTSSVRRSSGWAPSRVRPSMVRRARWPSGYSRKEPSFRYTPSERTDHVGHEGLGRGVLAGQAVLRFRRTGHRLSANVPHEFRALEDGTVDIDIFTPVRQDWIDGTASYLKSGLE